ncbi:MAG: hypothetical protein AAF533_13380 [Acidobacteriota bacterium]
MRRPAPEFLERMPTERLERGVLRLLRLGVVAVFLGRAWQHLRWDAPFRALLWNQDLMETPVRLVLGMSWREWAGSLAVDQGITLSIRGFGVLYLACGLLALIVRPGWRLAQAVLVAGGLGLSGLALLYWKDHLRHGAQLIEYSSQWAVVFLLLVALHHGVSSKGFLLALRLAIVGTFLGHGLYAIGWYETPGHYVTMIMTATGLAEPASVGLLRTAGVADVVACVLLFVPQRQLQLAALLYCTAWGFLTALARTWCHFSLDFALASLDQWLFETVLRLPHGLLPLALLGILELRRRAATTIDPLPSSDSFVPASPELPSHA